MNFDLHDTIVAIASAPGPALRGIVRLSGDQAHAIACSLCDPNDLRRVARPTMRAVALLLESNIAVAGAQIVLWPGSRTYTGQPLAELHLPGCAPLLERVLSTCCAQGARLAAPGEFTLRAFLNGRIDLTQAEAVNAAVAAENPAQLEAALRQLAGGLRRHIESLRARVFDRLALLEATLDFAEEPDVAAAGTRDIDRDIGDALAQVEILIKQLDQRERPRAVPRVALVGPPNAGKSRLFNALAGAEHALVADLPGTTRDFLEARCTWDGFPIDLVDTAGEEQTGDTISQRAQQHRAEQTRRADLLLVCRTGDTQPTPVSDTTVRTLQVWTKGDLARPSRGDYLVTSAATGEGVDLLKQKILATLKEAAESEPSCVAATGARCRESLLATREALLSACSARAMPGGDELVAMELRIALDKLGTIVGAVSTEELLDHIFGRFCIGK
jgi:tRNA modification GTPase